jgi:release factor glutamine methyltransferase
LNNNTKERQTSFNEEKNYDTVNLMNTINTFTYIQYIQKQLFPFYKDDSLCENYAWFLLEKISNKTKTDLIITQQFTLSPDQQNQIKNWIYLLTEKKMPIQYILGSVPFNDLTILVKPPILIPRPETEEWTINLVEQLKKLKNKNIQILDIATGSGCIALTLAYHLPDALVTATDISAQALQLAQENSRYNKTYNVEFIESDLFSALVTKKQFDIIVANPPYIAESEKKDIDESVTEWEDRRALFAPDNGLALIKQIIDFAPLYIKNNEEMKHYNIPQLAIEIGYQQGDYVTTYMHALHYNDVHIYKDLEQKDRVVVGRIDYVANSNA